MGLSDRKSDENCWEHPKFACSVGAAGGGRLGQSRGTTVCFWAAAITGGSRMKQTEPDVGHSDSYEGYHQRDFMSEIHQNPKLFLQHHHELCFARHTKEERLFLNAAY